MQTKTNSMRLKILILTVTLLKLLISNEMYSQNQSDADLIKFTMPRKHEIIVKKLKQYFTSCKDI